MLPLHDMPAERSPKAPKKPRAGIGRKAGGKSRPVDLRVVSALADPGRVLFLDVETTGLSWFYDEITIVGWAIDGRYHLHIAGEDPAPLVEALRLAQTLVTFNGTLFDLRFLRKSFGEIQLPPVHIDLRYLAKRAGLTGGQKVIESILGLRRDGIGDMDGAEAVLLWHRYLRGEKGALRRLVDYNRYDVVGMCGILDAVMDRLNVHSDLLFTRPRFADRKYAFKMRQIARDGVSTSRWRARPTFREVFSGSPAESATVVGIDLTGSEERPSGWCILRGSTAETAMISTDDEMVERIMAAEPALVSIDSPLCLPFGRTRVEDDDPGRDQFGIMRQCERALKRRGVNVYPCLLPSMQRLTRRGMQLAQRLRERGIPVIESYPGAAQDIMGIPRKGAGVEFLHQGLVDFGIRGNFVNSPVTHDELDAITSAIVGSFFLAGQYEGLDGPSEDPLIIPDLKPSKPEMMVIGISGRICAGKTTTARLLEGFGFAYTRFSLVLDEEIQARGQILNRQNRQAMGFEIHQSKGQRWLCVKALERVADSKLIVIDGLRFPEDHAYFFERFGASFVHLHIDAEKEVRAERFRKGEADGLSFEAVDGQPVEAAIGDLVRLARARIENNGSLAELRENVLNCLKSISQEPSRECLSQLL